LNWKKIESHFETWSSDSQRINLTFVAHSFVANFVRYISAKYYLNWFPFHTVIIKVLGVNFFLKHSVVTILRWEIKNSIIYRFQIPYCDRVMHPSANLNPLIVTLKPHSSGPSYSNTLICTLAVDGWVVTFGTATRGLGGAATRPAPSLLYQI